MNLNSKFDIITPESNILRIKTIEDVIILLPKSLCGLILEYEKYFKDKLNYSFFAHDKLYYIHLLSDDRIVYLGQDSNHEFSIKIWENNNCILIIVLEIFEIKHIMITDTDDIIIAVSYKSYNYSNIIKYNLNSGSEIF